MHTPEQAASLWCPMVRHPLVVERSKYVPVLGAMAVGGCNPEGKCIADKCAMWRLEGSTTYKFNPKFGLDLPTTKPTGRGYCGLAGRPEVMA